MFLTEFVRHQPPPTGCLEDAHSKSGMTGGGEMQRYVYIPNSVVTPTDYLYINHMVMHHK